MSKLNNKDNRINKKDNSKLINTLIIIGIVFLIASLVLMFTGGKKVYIKDISYKEYGDLVQKDEYSIILLTSPTCSHCVNYKPYVNLVASEYNLTVYNIDLSNLDYDGYIALHDKYTAIANEFDEDGTPIIPTPVTIITRNGEEVASTLGNIGQKGFTNLLKNNNVIKEQK